MGTSSLITLAEICDDILGLDTNDRLAYLVELGESLPPFPDSYHTEENRVLGCQSNVWLIARPNNDKLEFVADSDAPMVRGLIAILLAAYSGKRPREIVDFPIEDIFSRIKLRSYILPMRSNGLYSMVKRIQTLADLAIGGHLTPDENGHLIPSLPSPIELRGHASSDAAVAAVATSPPAKKSAGINPTSNVVREIPSKDGLEARKLGGGRPAPKKSKTEKLNDGELGVDLRNDFPILSRRMEDGRPLIYLDNAATTQRPTAVIQSMADVYAHHYSNVHRGGHLLASETTELYEGVRENVRRFINAKRSCEIVFTSGTTAAINLVARSWGDANLSSSDEILLTEMEHHSNIVPWQQLSERTGCSIRWLPVLDNFELNMGALDQFLTARTKLVSVTAVSNALGTINPIAQIIRESHKVGAIVVVDAAQAVPHQATDVQELGADFLAFSGHKMLGPSGVGVLYGRQELLESMPPFLGGGSMIRRVSFSGFEPADLPYKFEAGTPMIVPVIGLGTAIDCLQGIGMSRIHAHEQSLTKLAHDLLSEIPGMRFFGPAPDRKGGIVSFNVDGLHADEIAKVLDANGIAVRAGHHCAMPLHGRFGISASCRASFYLYNTAEEVRMLACGVRDSMRILRRK